MRNQAMEFHDATIVDISYKANVSTIRFSSLYVHASSSQPGIDAGAGWYQQGQLVVEGTISHISEASAEGATNQRDRPIEPCTIGLAEAFEQKPAGLNEKHFSGNQS